MVVFFTAALVLLRKFKMNPILVMVLCGVANMVFCAAAGSRLEKICQLTFVYGAAAGRLHLCLEEKIRGITD